MPANTISDERIKLRRRTYSKYVGTKMHVRLLRVELRIDGKTLLTKYSKRASSDWARSDAGTRLNTCCTCRTTCAIVPFSLGALVLILPEKLALKKKNCFNICSLIGTTITSSD